MKKETVSAIPVREFLKYTSKELLDNFRTNTYVLFEDDVLSFMYYKEIILTRYLLDLDVIKNYKEINIPHTYNIANYFTNGIFTAKSINSFFSVMLADIVNKLLKKNGDYSMLSKVYERMYEINNEIYNDIGYGKIEFSSSANILDYLEIQMHPKLIQAIQKVEETKEESDIYKAYDVLDSILRYDQAYAHNPISKAYVSGMVNANQIKQVLAPRGYVTEIDGSIFKYPIASSYTLSMKNIYELAVESRPGAKSLFLSNIAVQDSEYLAREIQLVTMAIENIVMGDCGTKKYEKWYVRPEDGTVKTDLGNLIGKYYLNEETGTEDMITKEHRHLISKNIKIRSPLYCAIGDKTKICSKCFGELTFGLRKLGMDQEDIELNVGLGHMAPTTATAKITQSILSTKHLTSSASNADIVLEGDALKFFVVKEKDGYSFKPNVLRENKTRTFIIIRQNELFGIKDIKTVEDINKLDISRISTIESMVIMTESPITGRNFYSIVVKSGNKYGSFTHKFLEYVIEKGYTLDTQDRYVIDVTDWRFTSPIMKLPRIEYSFLALAKELKSKLKTMKNVRRGVKGKETSESLLQSIFNLVNSKLDINLALFEIMVYAFTILDNEKFNYSLGRNTDNDEVSDIKHIIPGRSLSAAYAWESTIKTIFDPISFTNENRMDHPLDVMIKPAEVIKDYYGI